jgi:GGDEF domain-containing protein
MTYDHFRNLALVFGLALTLATTMLIYIIYGDPVEALGQALFVIILVFAVLYFQKGGGWAALAASVIYIAALATIGPKSGALNVLPAVILRVTMYGFTGVAGGEICARIKSTLEEMHGVDLIDHETGLFETDYFYRLAGASIEMFERYQSPFTLLIFNFDVEILKSMTRDVRAQALTTIGSEVKSAIRQSDEAGRPSVDSIAILLYNTDSKNSKAVVGRVTAACKQVFGDEAHIGTYIWSTPGDIEEIRAYAHAR